MTYFISDIHGEYELLKKLLKEINFSSSDKLYVLGDMIEKGEDSIAVMHLLKNLPNVKCIIGNHEYSFLKYYWGLVEQDPDDFDAVLKTLQDYFPFDRALLDWELIDWIEFLPYYIETEDFILVHAGLPIEADGKFTDRKKVTSEQFVYDRKFKDDQKISENEKCVMFGHTPVRYITGNDDIRIIAKPGRLPIDIKNIQKIHLDTDAYLSGRLGCFCLEELKCYYVSK